MVGVARSEESDDEFRERMKESVQEFGRDEFKQDVWDWLAEGMRYVATDFADEGGEDRVGAALNELDEQRGTAGNRVYYLAVPPNAIATLLQEIGERRSTEGWTRVIIEKPFGRDLVSAQALNVEISKRISTRARSSASTTTSARRRSRTCSRCGSRTASSSRSGTGSSSTTSRSPSPSRSGSRAAPPSTSRPARSATSSRTTCCSSSR